VYYVDMVVIMIKPISKLFVCIVIALSLVFSGVSVFPEIITTVNAATPSDDSTLVKSDVSKCSVPTKMILVRHGQTSWNALGLLQGNADVPLDATGVVQAQDLANSTYNKTVNVVYSSPLSRAYDTAQALADVHNLPVKVHGNLREMGVGIYTGYRASQIPSEVRISWTTNPDFAMPSGIPDPTNLVDPSYVEGIYFEGESLNNVSDRAWNGITNLAKQHCGENVVAVTHGGVIQIALTHVYGLPVTNYSKITVPTASQTVLEFEPDDSVVVLPDW
jgi:broad specificity phosphatase PhoE